MAAILSCYKLRDNALRLHTSEQERRQFLYWINNDLKRRLHEHQSGNVRSTWNRRPLELVYYEACLNEDDAKQRETYLKSGMGKKYIRNRLRTISGKFVTG